MSTSTPPEQSARRKHPLVGAGITCLSIGLLGLASMIEPESGFAGSEPGTDGATVRERTPGVQEAVRVVNTLCPIFPEHTASEDGTADPDMTITHDNDTYAVCCGECLEIWEIMSSQERSDVMDRLRSLEASADGTRR